MRPATIWSPASWVAGGLLFTLLATANAAGYRYGVSDQAFYIPVVVRALDAAAFPRDAALIDAQGRLMLADEMLAAIVRGTGIPMDILFLGAYLVSLAIIWAALILIGQTIYTRSWLTLALAAAFTLRHRIPRTSANSFEPYFHPRMLAFGLGALAIAAVLRERRWLAILLVATSALIHVTTAMWFSVLIGVAIAVLDRRLRRLAVAGGVAAAAFLVWAVTAGPLRASLTRMDEPWLRAVAGKDSLLASQWPVWAWAANLGLLAVLWWAVQRRRANGIARREDTAFLAGATALVCLFIVTFPAVVARLALPVQLQIPRVFWLVDFVATVYVLGVVRTERLARGLAAALVALSLVRAVYVMRVEHPERALFAIHLTASPWHEAMTWLNRQPVGIHVLADPGHAWKHGSSVRVSAGRDVFLEDVKDSALAIYSRDVAARYVERTSALGDFGALTADRARELALQYDLDYLVAEGELALPLAYSNEQFRIYSLAAAETARRGTGQSGPTSPLK